MSLLNSVMHRSYNREAESIRQTQAVIEFDTSGKILDANSLFLDAVGYAIDEIKGQHHAMFITPDERASAAYREFWKELAAGDAKSAQFLRVGKGGRRLWLQAIYTPIKDRSGRVLKVIKFATVHGGEKTIQWSACVCAGAGGVKVGHWIG